MPLDFSSHSEGTGLTPGLAGFPLMVLSYRGCLQITTLLGVVCGGDQAYLADAHLLASFGNPVPLYE